MRSARKRRQNLSLTQAEAFIDARNKVFNIFMALALVFTMLPITAFTSENQASAEPLNQCEIVDSNGDNASSKTTSSATSEASSVEDASNSEIVGGGVLIQPQ